MIWKHPIYNGLWIPFGHKIHISITEKKYQRNLSYKMAEFYVESFAGGINRTEMHNNDNQVFEFENAPYLTEFDESYNPNPDLDEAAHEDTRVCFRGKELSLGPCDHKCCEVWRLHPQKPTEMKYSTFRNNVRTMGIDQALLEEENNCREIDSPLESFLKHHGESTKCTDQECFHFSAWHKPAGLRRGGKACKSTHKKGGKRLMVGKSQGWQ